MSTKVHIGGFASHAASTIKRVKQQIIGDLFNDVVGRTPVLTGRLRSNWRVSKDSPDIRNEEGTGDPSSQVRQDVDKLVDERDQTIYLANGVPYGPMIEYEGHSTNKAPNGMVRLAIMQAAANAKAMKL